jgi:hypothetical protein
MTREYIAAYKDGSEFVPFAGGSLSNARGELDFADAHEEFIDAKANASHVKPVMLVRENGRAWRQMSSSDMRRAAN